eukprot:CAMPEP_0117559402 /NCGR_PEP_ID=MMETSP0784-20121206/53346_1 /TAXON_ID=39447 /ORGANISM="" /LENGTH=209 /DNA_ID=CAMNT_0005356787 /DNA_START=52 /DNA_END=681 /DNA_ORIENTATION=-
MARTERDMILSVCVLTGGGICRYSLRAVALSNHRTPPLLQIHGVASSGGGVCIVAPFAEVRRQELVLGFRFPADVAEHVLPSPVCRAAREAMPSLEELGHGWEFQRCGAVLDYDGAHATFSDETGPPAVAALEHRDVRHGVAQQIPQSFFLVGQGLDPGEDNRRQQPCMLLRDAAIPTTIQYSDVEQFQTAMFLLQAVVLFVQGCVSAL